MKLETVIFRIRRAICIACQFSISNHLFSFSVENIEKEILASNAYVATNAKKRPNRYLRNGRFFKLVEAPPQSPANTKSVLKRSPSDCGYAIL